MRLALKARLVQLLARAGLPQEQKNVGERVLRTLWRRLVPEGLRHRLKGMLLGRP
jgi:hypothetical protein